MAPALVTLGKQLVYEIVVRNEGTVGVKGVHVEEQLPPSVTFLTAAPQPLVRDRLLVWNLESVGPGQELRLKVELQPLGEGDVITHATVTWAAVCAMRARVVPLGLSLSLTGPSQLIRVGETANVGIHLVNNTNAHLQPYMVQVSLPKLGLIHEHEKGHLFQVDGPILRPGEKSDLNFRVTALQPGRQIVNVSILIAGVEEISKPIPVDVIDNRSFGLAQPTARAVSEEVSPPSEFPVSEIIRRWQRAGSTFPGS